MLSPTASQRTSMNKEERTRRQVNESQKSPTTSQRTSNAKRVRRQVSATGQRASEGNSSFYFCDMIWTSTSTCIFRIHLFFPSISGMFWGYYFGTRFCSTVCPASNPKVDPKWLQNWSKKYWVQFVFLFLRRWSSSGASWSLLGPPKAVWGSILVQNAGKRNIEKQFGFWLLWSS